MTAITAENLIKDFGDFRAIDKISLSIAGGEITAIVGPNGSGKTTFIKSILGLVKPTSGNIIVNGVKLNGTFKYREQIGYMPQQASFPENITVKETIDLLCDIRNKTGDLSEELIDKFNLQKEYNKKIKTLSGGTKQKLNAVIAFIFDPEILILDEPTAGLDPYASGILKDKILSVRKGGKTILLTSHILSELEDMAENVIFLLEGSIRYNGKVNDLIERTSSSNLERAIASLISGVAV
ncbi:MAG: ABC transporter ATP-binding protein [Bacteroidota bacterium]